MARTLFARLYGWACERLYYELAGFYDPVSALVSLGQWDSWRRLALDYIAGPVCVELGPGTGCLLAPLAARVDQVLAIERSPAMVELARSTLANTGAGNVNLLLGDAAALPLSIRCVDTIVATFPAPYILEPETLSECRRVLIGAGQSGAGQSGGGQSGGGQGNLAGGNMVVIGLWVRRAGRGWVDRVLRAVPLFYGGMDAASLAKIRHRFEANGFDVQLFERQCGHAYVGIAIARPSGSNYLFDVET